MLRYHVIPEQDGWTVRKARSSRATGRFKLRRDAISRAKELAGPEGVVTVHNSAGLVVIRIPELAQEKVAASVHIHGAARMTAAGRKEIASWLRKHANWLLKEGGNYAERFRGRYFYGRSEAH